MLACKEQGSGALQHNGARGFEEPEFAECCVSERFWFTSLVLGF